MVSIYSTWPLFLYLLLCGCYTLSNDAFKHWLLPYPQFSTSFPLVALLLLNFCTYSSGKKAGVEQVLGLICCKMVLLV